MEQEKDKAAGGYTLIPDSISSIPAKELSMTEKVLLCKIISLSKGRPCEMSNAAFASCFGVTGRRITEHIAKLKEKGLIEITGPRTKRYIKPTGKALSLWMETSIDGNVYRRKHLETEPSSTIDGSVLNYRRNHPPKNIENIESIDISANQDLHKQTSRPQSTRKKFIPPSLDEVEQYVEENGMVIDAKYFFDYYDTGDWQDKDGNPIKSWKQKALTWNRREQKERKSKPPAPGPVNLTAADLEKLEQEREKQADANMAELRRRMQNEEGEI